MASLASDYWIGLFTKISTNPPNLVFAYKTSILLLTVCHNFNRLNEREPHNIARA
jgi:hypothetical protein